MMDVRGDRFEHGEQETVDVEVTCRALTDAVSATSSSRIGPSRSTSRSPGPQHLHRIGVELGGEVAGRVTIREQVEMLPEQVLNQIVGVDRQCGDRCVPSGSYPSTICGAISVTSPTLIGWWRQSPQRIADP